MHHRMLHSQHRLYPSHDSDVLISAIDKSLKVLPIVVLE